MAHIFLILRLAAFNWGNLLTSLSRELKLLEIEKLIFLNGFSFTLFLHGLFIEHVFPPLESHLFLFSEFEVLLLVFNEFAQLFGHQFLNIKLIIFVIKILLV